MIRRYSAAFSGLIIAIGALALLQPHWIISSLAQASPRVLYFYETERPVVALTIDDGPASGTASILASLAMHDAKATFFIITERISGNEVLLGEMVANGHEIANHLTREEASVLLGRWKFERELVSAQRALDPYGTVRWFRPGSGWYSGAMLDVVEKHGLRTALGSIYPFDNYLRSPQLIADLVLSRVRPGAVIMLHDAEGRGYRTAQVLNLILPALVKQNYVVTTLSDLEAIAKLGD
jgi:peptidoglycan/xylan/chitin deacetylase (PgdA/CDA1 family)